MNVGHKKNPAHAQWDKQPSALTHRQVQRIQGYQLASHASKIESTQSEIHPGSPHRGPPPGQIRTHSEVALLTTAPPSRPPKLQKKLVFKTFLPFFLWCVHHTHTPTLSCYWALPVALSWWIPKLWPWWISLKQISSTYSSDGSSIGLQIKTKAAISPHQR